MKQPTIDEVRQELRNAIFMCAFQASGFDIQEDKTMAENFRQLACNMAVFGINSNLLPMHEANDWKDAVFGKQELADVDDKYNDSIPEYEK